MAPSLVRCASRSKSYGVSDPKGSGHFVEARKLLSAARAASGLSQAALAARAGTTQPTLSAYETGRKSPTLAVAGRILEAMGLEFDVIPRVTFEARQYEGSLRTFYVPDRLWRLSPIDCFGPPPARYRPGHRRHAMLRRREDRLALYIWMLEHSDPIELLDHLDGELLIECWHDITPAPPRTRAGLGASGPLTSRVLARNSRPPGDGAAQAGVVECVPPTQAAQTGCPAPHREYEVRSWLGGGRILESRATGYSGAKQETPRSVARC